MKRDGADLAHLWDMLAAARDVVSFVDGVSYDAFVRDRMRVLAVERGLEIVGEAAARVSVGFKAAHPEVPWAKLKGQRNRLAHEYDRLDYRALHSTATQAIAALIAVLQSIVDAAG